MKKKIGILWSLMLVLGVVLMAGGCGSGIGTELTGQVNFDRLVGTWVVQPDTFRGLVSISQGEGAPSLLISPAMHTLTGEINIVYIGRTHNPRRGEGTAYGRLRFDGPGLDPDYGWTLHIGGGGRTTFGSDTPNIYFYTLEGGGEVTMTFDNPNEPEIRIAGEGTGLSVGINFRARRQ